MDSDMIRVVQKVILRALAPLRGLGLRKYALVRGVLGALKPNQAVVLGQPFYLDPTDFSVSKEISDGDYEALEIETAKNMIRRADTIVDIGANIGYFTVHFCEWAPLGHVYAFEPNAPTFAILKKNVETRRFKNVSLYQAGLDTEEGSGTLYVNQYNKGDNRAYPSFGAEGIGIKMTTLDAVIPVGKVVDLIKIDIQGYEVRALFGMKRVLSESPNLKMLVECSPKLLRRAGSSAEEFFSLLEENDMSWNMFDNASHHLVAISKQEYIDRFPAEKDDYGNLLCWKGGMPKVLA